MNNNKSSAGFVIDQEETKARLDDLLSSLKDLKKTFETHSGDSDAEWQKIARSFDALMEESNVMPPVRKEKIGGPSTYLRSTARQDNLTTIEKGRIFKGLLEQRERLHAKERASDRKTINNLIEGKMLLAESFKTVLYTICTERDNRLAKQEARYQELWDEYEELAFDRAHRPSRLHVKSARFEGNWGSDSEEEEDEWSGEFEGITFKEAMEKAMAKAGIMRGADAISDEDFDTDDEELRITLEDPDVDRRPVLVDRQPGTGWDDEINEERFMRLWIWKPRQQPPEPVISAVKVYEEPQDEEGRPHLSRILRKDNTPEALYMHCMVDDCTKGPRMKPLVCLIDTGASTNIISWNEVKRLGIPYEEGDVGEVSLVGGNRMPIDGVARNVTLRIGGALVQVDLNIMTIDDNRIGETILGTGFLRSVGAVIDFEARRLSFGKIDPDKFHYWFNVAQPNQE